MPCPLVLAYQSTCSSCVHRACTTGQRTQLVSRLPALSATPCPSLGHCLSAALRTVSQLIMYHYTIQLSCLSVFWLHSAGCFAAGTGFLLNFTISEHPQGRQPNRSSSTLGSQAPLAPDQHRLTDDGEPIKPAAATQQGRQQRAKGSKPQLGGEEEGASYGVQREEQGGSQLVDGQSEPGRLFQGAVAQIKVSSESLAQGAHTCRSCCWE